MCQVLQIEWPRPAKALPILPDTTVRRFAVGQEDLKPYWKLEKKATFLLVISNPIIYKFIKDPVRNLLPFYSIL